MKQEDKELLLKDLSARLPYGVMCSMGLDYPLPLQRLFVDRLDGILLDFYEDGNDYQVYLNEVKPYLRSMSSMTEQEKEEYHKLCDSYYGVYFNTVNSIDWLNRKMFAYRTIDGKDMFELGLALKAPEGMYGFNVIL
jgi:hypothetical protein